MSTCIMDSQPLQAVCTILMAGHSKRTIEQLAISLYLRGVVAMVQTVFSQNLSTARFISRPCSMQQQFEDG